jgi:CelD/BcsL family acetyltransferase involved in cellulose biosynthesis
VTVVRHQQIGPLADEWDDLADRAGASPFLRPGWIEAWLAAFGGGAPEIVALRREGRLAAVLPLVRRRGALVSPTNWHTPEWGVLAEDDASAQEAVAAALAARPRRLSLAFLGPGAEAARAAVASAGYSTLERTLLRSPTLALAGDRAAYMASRSSKRRKELARQRRRLEEGGAVAFEVDETAARLEEGLAVEGSGWKLERGTAIVSQPETVRFYTEVARWAERRGALRLGFLRLDGRAVAFEYCLEEAGVLYDLKGGYDHELRSCAPGMLIAQELVAWAFARGLARFELLGQAEPQKLYWTEDVHERTQLQAFAPTLSGRLEDAAWRHGRPLVRRLRTRVGR